MGTEEILAGSQGLGPYLTNLANSRTEFMHYFLNYGRQLTQEEIDALEEDERAIKKQYPTLDQFKEQINFYENLHDQLKNIENLKVIQVLILSCRYF